MRKVWDIRKLQFGAMSFPCFFVLERHEKTFFMGEQKTNSFWSDIPSSHGSEERRLYCSSGVVKYSIPPCESSRRLVFKFICFLASFSSLRTISKYFLVVGVVGSSVLSFFSHLSTNIRQQSQEIGHNNVYYRIQCCVVYLQQRLR